MDQAGIITSPFPTVTIPDLAFTDYVYQRAAELANAQDCGEDSESPSRTDNDPARVVAFRVAQHNVGHHTISKQDQNRGPNELGQISMHGIILEGLPTTLKLVTRDG